MFCAPFRDLFAFIVSDGRSDFPQHLLIDAAHRRSQRARRFRGVEIENAHKVFVFKVVFRLQTAAQHQGITDTDLGGIPEGNSDVEFIILFQKRIFKDAEDYFILAEAKLRWGIRSLIHISEPTRLLSISYAVFCLNKKNG